MSALRNRNPNTYAHSILGYYLGPACTVNYLSLVRQNILTHILCEVGVLLRDRWQGAQVLDPLSAGPPGLEKTAPGGWSLDCVCPTWHHS